jgi:hypothetical protein
MAAPTEAVQLDPLDGDESSPQVFSVQVIVYGSWPKDDVALWHRATKIAEYITARLHQTGVVEDVTGLVIGKGHKVITVQATVTVPPGQSPHVAWETIEHEMWVIARHRSWIIIGVGVVVDDNDLRAVSVR